ncbi:MAG: hypothetical protein JXR03_05320 [Cyclobacteriaceae bacterium]
MDNFWTNLFVDGILFKVLLPSASALVTFFLIQNRLRKKDIINSDLNALMKLIQEKMYDGKQKGSPFLSEYTKGRIRKMGLSDLENEVKSFLNSDQDKSINLKQGKELIDKIEKL